MLSLFTSWALRKNPRAANHHPAQQKSYTLWQGLPISLTRRQGYYHDVESGYAHNVIAHRCIKDIASSASVLDIVLYQEGIEVDTHPLLSLLKKPNPLMGQQSLLEGMYHQLQVAGNAYLEAVLDDAGMPSELWLLRSDMVQVTPGKGGIPTGYLYKCGQEERHFPVHPVTGQSNLLHLKQYHPLDDWYGLSPFSVAMDAIEQHNAATLWNNALLKNGCRPSGALVVENAQGGQTRTLDEGQFSRLKEELDIQYSGAANAGRPLLLEGGLKWIDMMIHPKDMDFLNMRHAAARDIALAFGYPPLLLGIPGDNTYNNQKEARLALWEQTILPMVGMVMGGLSHWLSHWYGEGLTLRPDEDAISALNPRREALWTRVGAAGFLTDVEKRETVGYSSEG
jgi:HK97 family phage portal protein